MTPEQFNSLSQKELKGYTQILASAGNKRIKRAQEQGFTSPSIEAVLNKGKFSTKDKNINQLRNEFMRAKRLLTSKTGTLSEFKKWRAANIESLKQSGINITPDQFDTFWKSYEKLKKDSPELASKGLKYYLLSAIDEMQKEAPEISVDEITEGINENLDFLYEEEQAQTMQAEENASELDFWGALDEISQEMTPKKAGRRDDENDRSAARAAIRKARRKRK